MRRVPVTGMLLLLLATPTWASEILAEAQTTPLKQRFLKPLSLPAGHELVVTGENPSAKAVTLVLRIDDGMSRGYATRVNYERVLPSGPFTLRFPASGLRTPSGRMLDPGDVRALMLFVADGQPALELTRLAVEAGLQLPAGSHAWDLGPDDGPLFPGFEPVGVGDSRVEGKFMRPVHRPSGDALLADGIRGLERFRVPLPNGRWRVTLWLEDLGEWEYLPHPLQRTIRANGKVVHHESRTARDWVKGRYLRGYAAEAVLDGDPWQVFRAQRGGRSSFSIDVSDGHLAITLSGDGPASQYLAGMLAEPADNAQALGLVTAARAARFRESWRFLPQSLHQPAKQLTILSRPFTSAPDMQTAELETGSQGSLLAAPDTWLTLDYFVVSPLDDPSPGIQLSPPVNGSDTLPGELRFGHWRFERPNPQATLLVPTPDHLRGDLDAMRLVARVPRRLNLRLHIPAGAVAGHYRGKLRVVSHDQEVERAISIQVLPVALPAVERPVGIYLERAPHLGWFEEFADERSASLQCDLRLLRKAGLTGLAPPLEAPFESGETQFLADMTDVRAAGFRQSLLAYTPVKRLARRLPPRALAERLAETGAALASRGLSMPVWAIADEPAVDGEFRRAMRELSDALHFAMPNAKTAGQLNNPDQATLLSHLDVVLLNHGFGVDGEQLTRVRETGTEVWLYNLPRVRLAAGFYLWRVGAGGYLQWHGRMPTADPFDPTDGRETDVQWLFPATEACPGMPDVHAALFEMSEGIVDLRWLLWLEEAQRKHPEARQLLSELKTSWPPVWDEVERLGEHAAANSRARIMQLAQALQRMQ